MRRPRHPHHRPVVTGTRPAQAAVVAPVLLIAPFVSAIAESDRLRVAYVVAAAIRRVRAGERVVGPQLAAEALGVSASPLTDREADVLRASASGATVADIARELSLSPSTVRNYLSDAIGKLGVRNRLEAFTVARDRGWL